MIDVETWDVCLANVMFEDVPESKVRPVLVLNGGAVVIECIKMTSKPPRTGEYEVKMWKEAGLHKPTTVRLSKRLCLDANRVLKRIGHLDPVDIIKIEQLI